MWYTEVRNPVGLLLLSRFDIALLPVSVMGDTVSVRGEEEVKELVGVEAELYRWFRVQGATEEGSRRVVALLNSEYLLVEPRPRRWNRRGDFGHQERCRYLWYRHAARILGWCDRQQFPDFIRGLLRDQYYPSQHGITDEETRANEDVLQAGASLHQQHSQDRGDNPPRGTGDFLRLGFCICLSLILSLRRSVAVYNLDTQTSSQGRSPVGICREMLTKSGCVCRLNRPKWRGPAWWR